MDSFVKITKTLRMVSIACSEGRYKFNVWKTDFTKKYLKFIQFSGNVKWVTYLGRFRLYFRNANAHKQRTHIPKNTTNRTEKENKSVKRR